MTSGVRIWTDWRRSRVTWKASRLTTVPFYVGVSPRKQTGDRGNRHKSPPLYLGTWAVYLTDRFYSSYSTVSGSQSRVLHIRFYS